ncbi:TetR/AcrR family transcriptional regulator [Nocardioides rubriscoriae]|uniref:TetR/AcrR family transcriptional regulator n=1 Tax=Nocardioides rubriscoriae TaxID=642762 RepID=UPI0011E060A8|nr:TetR/AcrR family transcriptional regulator [Nocardioides rubriscoriae]
MDATRLLPLAGEPPAERSDAARNREALLRAASELIDHCSVESVTMDAVAQRAGVGKGTVFRRFESREGLMAALLDHSETTWQASVISGPPPLGPGAPPLERLLAFGHSRMETTLTHAALIRAAGHAGTRAYAVAAFAAMHVRYLLGQLDVHGDLGYLATALLAPLEIPVLEQQLGQERRSLDEVRAGWDDLVRRVVA